jgi:ferritin-like metal-binding protein YciE
MPINQKEMYLKDIRRLPLYNFFVQRLKNMYWMEQQWKGLLSRLKTNTSHAGMESLIDEYASKVSIYHSRLGRIFEILEEEPAAIILDEATGIIRKINALEAEENTSLKDLKIVMLLRLIVHTQIAYYDHLNALAEILGLEEICGLFNSTLIDSTGTDALLSTLSRTSVNLRALNAPLLQHVVEDFPAA